MSEEVLFEFTRLGDMLRVTATGADSLIEVSLVAPAGMERSHLARIALRKLARARRRRGGASRQGGPRGWTV